MDLIVLAKYVPNIDAIPANAWDYDSGTLIRSRLQMFFNTHDRVALNMALAIRKARPGDRIHVLSMGPQSAAAMLREAIAYGADHAWLLTDRNFAGADTIATAYALSGAIVNMVQTGRVSSEYAVFCGMQSPDGDTAQVPAQVAYFLDAPLYPYVTDLTAAADGFEFQCLNTVGAVTVRSRQAPFVATATRLYQDLPFYVRVDDMLRAETAEIPALNCADLGIDESRVGQRGSRTRVTRVFSPSQKHKAHVVLFEQQDTFTSDMNALLHRLSLEDTRGAEPSSCTETAAGDESGEAWYCGPCVALCEVEEAGLTIPSLEISSQAARFARRLGQRAVAIFVSPDERSIADKLQQYGIQEVVFVTGLPTDVVCVHDRARAIAAVIRELRPQIVIASATLAGRVIAPYVSAELNCGLTADCSVLEIKNATLRKKVYPKVLHQTRPALGGNIMATILSVYENSGGEHPPQMATVRPGVLEARVQPSDTCSTRVFEGAGFRNRFSETYTARQIQTADDHTDLTAFEVVVCVGAGIDTRADITRHIGPFCRFLEHRLKKPVGLGCTRSAVDKGLLPHSHQIGQTGVVIKPKIYIGIGVSGAVQHKIGMENAETIMSINSNREAPITAFSDYVIVGDYKAILGKIAV